VNAPARRRVPASLRLRTSLRDQAAVPGTKRHADTVRHAAPGSLEPESSVVFPREVKSPALKPVEIHSPAQQSRCARRIRAHWRVKSPNSGDPRCPFTHRASNLVLQGSLRGESPAAFRGKVAPSPMCSTWNTSATGLGGATRLPLIGRGSLGARRFCSIRLAAHASLTRGTGLRAQPAIGFPGRGESSCPSTSPPIPERHPRRCTRDSRRATRRRRRSLRSGATRRPLHPSRQGSLAGSLGELDLSVAWLAPARGYLRKRSPGSSAAIGCLVEVNALTRRCLSRSSV